MNDQTSIPMRTLGKTGIQVTPIGLGVMELSGGGGTAGLCLPGHLPGRQECDHQSGFGWRHQLVRYGGAVWQRRVGAVVSRRGLKAAGKANGEVVVATKWWPLFRTAGNIPRQHPQPAALSGRLRHRQLHGAPALRLFHAGSRDGCYGRSGGSREDPLGGGEQLQSGAYAARCPAAGEARPAAGGEPGALQPAAPGYRAGWHAGRPPKNWA